MGVEQKILLPDIGDFPEVDVIEVLVNPGDRVAVEDPLITLESDKATMEIPSTHAGVVREIGVKVGDKIAQGSLIAVVLEDETSDVPKGEDEVSLSARDPQTVAAPPPDVETQQVQVPDLGDFDDVEVIEILVAPGDLVASETPLITLETDKATMEIPSPAAGTVKELLIHIGDRVSAGAPILSLSATDRPSPVTAAAATTPVIAPPVPAPPAAPKPPPVSAPNTPASPSGAHASPSIRKFARELGRRSSTRFRYRAQRPHRAARCQ